MAKKIILLQDQKNLRDTKKFQQELGALVLQFNNKLHRLKKFGAQLKNSEYIDHFTWLLANLVDPAKSLDWTTTEKLQELEKHSKESTAHKLRLRDLQSAAFSPQDFETLKQALTDMGFLVDYLMPLFHNEHLIGFSIRAHKV